MKKSFAVATIARQYKNNGQHAEQAVRFTLTGKLEKADNLPHNLGGDCGTAQIKSARATVCKGTDLHAYIAEDAAETFIYVLADLTTAYEMDKATYTTFCELFAVPTFESQKNGGGAKLRLKAETREMRAWLAE